MHESVGRLLQHARDVTRDTREPVHDFADLAKRLGVSSAVMTNWKRRGVSKEGAIAAELALGCSAQWILTGQGPALAEAREANADDPTALPLGGQMLVLDEALRHFTQEEREDLFEYIKMKVRRSKAPHVQDMQERLNKAVDKIAERAAVYIVDKSGQQDA